VISVIIATRNRARLLESTLEAITSQRWPGQPFELIVADNASTDDTHAVVDRAARHGEVPVVYLHESRPGKSHALNLAIARARGWLFVLTDDDVLPEPSWLSAYVRAFEETGADFAAGRILPLWEVSPPRWMSPALYGVLAIPDGGPVRLPLARGLNDHVMPIGANMAVRRHVVERIGGWNTSLGKLQGTLRTGEDHEFALRMTAAGFTGVYEPRACVRHRVPAERLHKRYFHRWFYDNGAIVADLEATYPTTNRHVLRIPRYLWRRALADAFMLAGSVATFDARRRLASASRLLWFAGFARRRWMLSLARQGSAPAGPAPGSGLTAPR
jgi:glycosyltransferase involved in cell wall biosynthesis